MSTSLAIEPTVSETLPRQGFSQASDSDAASSRLTRLLQCKRTGMFWAGGAWTPNEEFATNFHDSGEAISVCVQKRLMEVELVIRLPGEHQDVFRTVLR